MRSFSIASFLLLSSACALHAQCDSLIRLDTKAKGGEVQISVRNTSKHPIIAYVVISKPAAPGDTAPARVYSGVFTDGDSLLPSRSLLIATVAASNKEPLMIDYVRLRNSQTCGMATSEAARKIAAGYKRE